MKGGFAIIYMIVSTLIGFSILSHVQLTDAEKQMLRIERQERMRSKQYEDYTQVVRMRKFTELMEGKNRVLSFEFKGMQISTYVTPEGTYGETLNLNF